MAIRIPLYYNLGTAQLQQMSSAEINEIVSHIAYRWTIQPTVKLSTTTANTGNLTVQQDTRWSAGAFSQTNTTIPSEATTQEPQLVTVNYQRILQSLDTVILPSQTLTDWPVFYTSGNNIQSMSLQDMKDTFFHPAINILTQSSTASSLTGNTYIVSTSASGITSHQPVGTIPANTTYAVTNTGLSAYVFTGSASGNNPSISVTQGATLTFNVNASGHPFFLKSSNSPGSSVDVLSLGVINNGTNLTGVGQVIWDTHSYLPGTYYYICSNHSNMVGTITLLAQTANIIYTDTRADLSLFTAAGIPEAQDQPITINNYYLHKRNVGVDPTYSKIPVFATSTGNLQRYNDQVFSNKLTEWIRYLTINSADGFRLRYSINGSGFTRGTSMVNSIVGLTNEGDYQTVQIGDDYRAQEFPASVPVATANIYNLTIDKT